MKYLVFNALAIKTGYDTSVQLGKMNSESVSELYLKNAFVSLSTAKINNPDIDVCLFVNFDVSEKYAREFNESNIMIKKINFDSFVLSEKYPWALAFFKLNALKYAVENME